MKLSSINGIVATLNTETGGIPILSGTAQYALRAVVYLAGCSGGPPVRAVELADAVDVPHNYMGKILHQLVRAGILKSVRGKHGGFELDRPPEGITLLQLVSLFDDLGVDNKCLFGRVECGGGDPCPAHEKWGRVAEQIVDFFRNTTVSDVLK